MRDYRKMITVEGVFNGSRVGKRHYRFIPETTHLFDGCKLDELNITVELKRAKDINDLIRVLEVHKHCFDTRKKICEKCGRAL